MILVFLGNISIIMNEIVECDKYVEMHLKKNQLRK